MASPQTNALPAQARKRIEQLETTVSELKGALGQVIDQMQSQGFSFLVEKGSSTLLKSLVRRRGVQEKTARKRPPGAARKLAIAEVVKETSPARAGHAGAVARGEAAKVQWVKAGEIVPAKTLAERWALTPQALGPAADRGEVFAIVVKRQRYYPKEFLELDRATVAQVSKALGSLSPSEKLIFWKRPHGALGGRTVLQALTSDAGQAARAAQLAQAWAAEGHTESDDASIS